MPTQRIRLVDKDSDVEQAIEWLGDMDPVGADVERDDAKAYWLRAALVQIGGNGKVVLFDPMTLSKWYPLADWLADKCLILHAMENDIWPLARLGLKPEVVEDTSLAAAFLGYERGLGDLLHHMLGVDLDVDKEAMQRSPWERRPLTPDEIAYAAGDVADLPELWDALADELERCGRWDWYVEELDYLRAQPDPRHRRDWHKVKGVGRLNPLAKARAKAIWSWREDLAQRIDMAPHLIMADPTIVDLAIEPVTMAVNLPGRGMTRRMVRLYGDEVISVLKGPLEVEDYREANHWPRPNAAQRALCDEIRQLRTEMAEAFGLNPGMLLPTKVIESGVLAPVHNVDALKDAFHLRDWQFEIMGDELAELVLNSTS